MRTSPSARQITLQQGRASCGICFNHYLLAKFLFLVGALASFPRGFPDIPIIDNETNLFAPVGNPSATWSRGAHTGYRSDVECWNYSARCDARRRDEPFFLLVLRSLGDEGTKGAHKR